MVKTTAWLALVSVCGSIHGADPSPHVSPYQKVLRELGYEPTGQGARQFLRSILPSDKTRDDFKKLLLDLDAEDFGRREMAMQTLLSMPNLPSVMLNRAAESNSFEVRWRARHVLDHRLRKSDRLLLASFKLIQHDPPARAAGDVLAIIPYCRAPYVIAAAHQALRAAASKEDDLLFRNHLEHVDGKLRIAAIIGLSKLRGADSSELLRPLLADPADQVALAASRALADVGDRSSLGSLLRLLDSDDGRIRSESALVLRVVTSESFGFVSHDSPDTRRAAVRKWKSWITTAGTTAKLNYPLAIQPSARGPLHGNTLVSTGSKGKVLELDPAGKAVWTFDLAAWSAEKLLNGNVLVASYTAKKVVEVDSAGNVVWELAGPSAMTAKPLLNGNYLIADFAGHRVIEVDRNKRTVWQHQTPEECFDADRLPNGNTIFGCPNRIREVTPDGDTAHEWEIPGRLNGFQALPNGNVIVANYGQSKVCELARDGEIIWEMEEKQPCDVFRLDDGRMLVSTAKRIIEVGPDRKILRVVTDARYGSARQ